MVHCGKWCVLAAWALLPGAAQALCDVTYRVQPGDSAQSIAGFHYGDVERADLIAYANQGLMPGGQLVQGSDIYIPCASDAPAREVTRSQTQGVFDPDAFSFSRQDAAADTPLDTPADTPTDNPYETAALAAPVAPAPVPVPAPAPKPAPAALSPAPDRAELMLLTGGNYAPFADQTWPGDGMATELVLNALGEAPSPVTHALEWQDDWSQHLFPLLDERRFDMGFPWLKPDCDATPDNALCANFHFSDPLMDLPMMLFAKAGSGLRYDSDADIEGLRLCRPAGYFTHDLDRPDRQWLTLGTITLTQPATPEDCFQALMADEIDAVTLNVFLGASKIVSMGLRGRVEPMEKPLSRETLHVIISKKHWRGTTHLYRVNAGLAALRESGRYNEVVERHLETFWERLK